MQIFSCGCPEEDSFGLCGCPYYQIRLFIRYHFLTTGYAKYAARLQKMFRVLPVMDLWKSGMIEDSWKMTITHPAGLVDAGEDSHFVIS